ncbi:unnamed protein product [Vicia faba]|uniref:S-protein homolog n=1 Tax=Vicia faba TaxID=3906 RepID=A0AAV1AUK3_VICFA|nr:unnamed protein product [Vicia faba]
MSPVTKKFLLLCVLAVLSVNNVLGKVHVKITNSLTNKLNLTIHCKSKDDDLGVHLLHPNESFSFQFKRKFFGGTLFYCSFQWNNELRWFDIYKQTRDVQGGDDFNWSIKESGPCVTIVYSTQPFCFPWNPKLLM